MDNPITPEPALKLPFRILVVAAHPDDIEFGSAGSVARWTDQGAEVTYCLVTDGSAGSNDPKTDLEELIEQRREEQLASAAAVGVKDVRFLGYRDGVLQPTLELRRDLTRLIREIRPDRVVCSDPTLVFAGDFYINHPDHRAAAEAAIYAVFPSAGTRPIFPELLAEGLEPHNVSELYIEFTFNPTLYVDTSQTIERKWEALRHHKSQLGDAKEAIEFSTRWDKEAGERFGCTYAEQFKVMRFNRSNGTTESSG